MAKKKAPKITKKTSAKTKKLATPKSNVRVRGKEESKINPQKAVNRKSTAATEGAKSGVTASQKAEERNYEMRKRRNSAVSRIKTVNVRSGGLPSARGGMGGGMNWSTK